MNAEEAINGAIGGIKMAVSALETKEKEVIKEKLMTQMEWNEMMSEYNQMISLMIKAKDNPSAAIQAKALGEKIDEKYKKILNPNGV